MTRAAVLVALLALALAAAGCAGDAGAPGASDPAAATTGASDGSAASAHSPSQHAVAGTFEPDATTFADCGEGDARCLEQAFGNLAYREGPKAALARLDGAMPRDAAVEGDCHRIAHTIGSAALARYHGNVAEAFAAGSASCWSGYYHGILERSFVGVSSSGELASVARDICADPGIESTTFLLYQCVHGLGHGLMIYSGYNLPFSLRICDRLRTEWDQTSCTGGVFMENLSSTYGVKSKWLRDDDPVYPCDAVQERHKLYCYLMVTSRINELNGFEWRKTAETCRRVEHEWIGVCFESYGRDASGSTRQDAAEAARLCSYAGAYEGSCVYGAARDMTSNYANGRRASELCRRIGESLRPRCFRGIGTILGNLEPADEGKRRACAAVTPKAYVASCVAGAGVRLAGVVESTG